MASYGIPFPGSQQPQYVNPNAYSAHAGNMQMPGMPGMGAMPGTAPAADPYANAQPGTIAYAKSEGPDGIATYTPVIAQETWYPAPGGGPPTRGIKWVTATSTQTNAAGIPPGAITASSPAQLPATVRAMPAMAFPPGELPGGYSMQNAASAATPSDDYPVMRPGMSQREYDKAVKRWEKDKEKERRAAEKRARKEEKERKRDRDRDRDRDRWENPDPYGIAGDRQRRMSTGAPLAGGFERARRISGGAGLRDDELARKLESLDTTFSARRERRMSGGAYAPSAAGGYRSRKGSMSEAGRDRKISGGFDGRQNFYPTAGPVPGAGGYPGYHGGGRSVPASPVRPHSAFPPSSHYDEPIPHGGPSPRPGHYNRSRHPSPSMGSTYLPGGYGGSYGGARDPAAASAYSYDTRTPFSTAASLPGGGGDSYALTRRPAGGPPASMYQVSGRELNRAQPFTPFAEFFLVEDLRELLQPQPPPLPAALVPHDVMAEEWDRCMQDLIRLASPATQSTRSSALDPLIDLISQWNTEFFLPRGVDISVYKGNSRRSGPPMNMPSSLRSYDESESDSDSSSSSSSSSTSESEDDRYYSSARREQKAAKKADRKARRKEKARRRRARRRQRAVSIRIRAVPLN